MLITTLSAKALIFIFAYFREQNNGDSLSFFALSIILFISAGIIRIKMNTHKAFIVFALVSLAGVIIKFSDIVITSSDDIKRYDWIQIFTPNSESFSQVIHDIDSNEYSFSFRTTLDKESFFDEIEINAQKSGWLLWKKPINR